MKALMILALLIPSLGFAAPQKGMQKQGEQQAVEIQQEPSIDEMNFDKEFSDEELQGLFIEEDADAPQTTQGDTPESEEALDL